MDHLPNLYVDSSLIEHIGLRRHPSESQHGLATGNEKLIFVPVCIVRVGVSDELGWRI